MIIRGVLRAFLMKVRKIVGKGRRRKGLLKSLMRKALHRLIGLRVFLG